MPRSARSRCSRSRRQRERRDSRAAGRPGRRRGGAGPRSWQAAQRARRDQAILDATLRMLGTHGVAGMTIEGVAAEAGVGKTTIYRRWPTKTELILAAISDIVPRGDPPDTGSMAGDMAALAETQRERLAGSRLAGIVPRLLAESMSDPELHRDLRRQGDHPIPRLAPVVHRAGDRARRAPARSRGGGARGPAARDTRLQDPHVARRPGLARAGPGRIHAAARSRDHQ